MKKLWFVLASLCLLLTEACVQERVVYVAESLDSNALVIFPNTVYAQEGRPRQKKPTFGSIEVNGEQVHTGNIILLSRGDTTSIYQVGADTSVRVVLLNADYFYSTETGVLQRVSHFWGNINVECLVMEPDPCECNKKNGIQFDNDSITKNMMPRQKMILNLALTDVLWINDGIRLVPAISSIIIDEVDPQEAVYGLAISTTDGATCDVLWLERQIRNTKTKDMVYQLSLRDDGLRFMPTPAGYSLDGRLITGFKVVRGVKPQSKGTKKQKHKGETKT